MESFNNHILMYAPKRSAFRYLTRIYISYQYHIRDIYFQFLCYNVNRRKGKGNNNDIYPAVFLLFISYSFEAYKCRCFLAAIDYSKHIERETARDKKGNIRF